MATPIWGGVEVKPRPLWWHLMAVWPLALGGANLKLHPLGVVIGCHWLGGARPLGGVVMGGHAHEGEG